MNDPWKHCPGTIPGNTARGRSLETLPGTPHAGAQRERRPHTPRCSKRGKEKPRSGVEPVREDRTHTTTRVTVQARTAPGGCWRREGAGRAGRTSELGSATGPDACTLPQGTQKSRKVTLLRGGGLRQLFPRESDPPGDGGAPQTTGRPFPGARED